MTYFPQNYEYRTHDGEDWDIFLVNSQHFHHMYRKTTKNGLSSALSNRLTLYMTYFVLVYAFSSINFAPYATRLIDVSFSFRRDISLLMDVRQL